MSNFSCTVVVLVSRYNLCNNAVMIIQVACLTMCVPLRTTAVAMVTRLMEEGRVQEAEGEKHRVEQVCHLYVLN